MGRSLTEHRRLMPRKEPIEDAERAVQAVIDFSRDPRVSAEDKEIIDAACLGKFTPLILKTLGLPDSFLAPPLKILMALVLNKQWPAPAKPPHRPRDDPSKQMAMELHCLTLEKVGGLPLKAASQGSDCGYGPILWLLRKNRRTIQIKALAQRGRQKVDLLTVLSAWRSTAMALYKLTCNY
jgi:hypothetical protein